MTLFAVESTTLAWATWGDWLMTDANWSEDANEFKKQNKASISLAITALLIGKI